MKQDQQKLKKNTYCTWGFVLGLLSIPFSFIFILPILGLIFCLIGLIRFNSDNESGKWMGITGTILNVLYFFVGLYGFGIIG